MSEEKKIPTATITLSDIGSEITVSASIEAPPGSKLREIVMGLIDGLVECLGGNILRAQVTGEDKDGKEVVESWEKPQEQPA